MAQARRRLLYFPLEGKDNLFTYAREGKAFSFVFGESGPNDGFIPSVTVQMLNLHSAINFFNGGLKTRVLKKDARKMNGALENILLDSCFLEHTFIYCHAKTAILAGRVEALSGRNDDLNAILASYETNFDRDATAILTSLSDQENISERIGRYPLKDYSWIDTEISVDTKTINGYALPASIIESYIRDTQKA